MQRCLINPGRYAQGVGGLLANLVAARVAGLADPADRALVWFIQMLWHRDGGLDKTAAELLKTFPDLQPQWLGKCEDKEFGLLLDVMSHQISKLPEAIETLCREPRPTLKDPELLPGLVARLREYMAAHIERQGAGAVTTAVGKRVQAALKFTRDTGLLSLISGQTRRGKTHAVRAWCDQHPGEARLVEVPPNADEASFYRAMARVLGTSESGNLKAHELRKRIEDTLLDGGLMLVFDEAHRLLPTREAAPRRIAWLMAQINQGVPIALVTTPQFFGDLRHSKKRGWNFAQFEGRVGHYEPLPDELSDSDLELVARATLPEGSAKAVRLLAVHAKASTGYLASIDFAVKRARFIAEGAGRSQVTDGDIAQAITESKGAESALSDAMHFEGRAARRASQSRRAVPAKGPSLAVEPPHSGERGQQPAEPSPEPRVEFTTL